MYKYITFELASLHPEANNRNCRGCDENGKYCAPRVGLEPTSLKFWAGVLPLHHVGSLMSPLYTHTRLFMWLFASEVSADYYTYIYSTVSC